MRALLGRSLRRKLLTVMLLATGVALLVAMGGLVAFDLRSFHQRGVADLAAQADLLARTTAPALAFDDARVARDNLDVLQWQPRVRAAALYDNRGRRFAAYQADGERASDAAPAALPSLPGDAGVAVVGDELLATQRVVLQGDIVGTVFLRARYGLVDHLWGYLRIALPLALFAMAVAWGVSAWLRRIVMRPIVAIGEVAHGVVTRQDYTQRVARQDDAEINELVEAYNRMMDEVAARTEALETSNAEKAREVVERRQAQQEVMRLNASLERRVSERTAQLEASNAELARMTEAAEQANRAKSEFLSTMSHELRTPLNAVIGFGQLMASAADGQLDEPRRRQFSGHIVQAGQHLLTLINDVLHLAQIEAGRMQMNIDRVELQPLLEDCRMLIAPQAEPSGIRLLFPTRCLDAVRADPTRLKQVLLNLLSNAVKYNREHGSVVVDCRRVSSEQVTISVQDTGQGLRPDQVEQLFQPFNRLGQEHGRKEGTGVGLVVTKHLVELMGGSLGISSIPGSGTRFWIDLPADPESVEGEPTAWPTTTLEGVQAGGLTLLCVEDDPASLALIQELIAARPDVRLIEARDGAQGIRLARIHQPRVILMDNHMPVLSGAQAQALLRQDPELAQVPVIAISANAMPGAAERALAAGYFRYLTKPLDARALNEAIDAALAASAGEGGGELRS